MNCVKCKAVLPDGAVYCHMCGKKQVQSSRKALKRPNGTGTVYKLSGRRKRPWVAAKDKVIIGYYETKKEAHEALDKLAGRNITERYNMTFAEVYEAWKIEHYREITQGVQARYDTAYHYFKSLHLKHFRVLRVADYQPLFDALEAKGRKAGTLSKYKDLLTQMSDWAVREEIVTNNFAKYIKLPPTDPKEKETFTPDEIKVLESSEDDAAKIILMLLATGMRIGELFQLPLADYHGKYVIGGEKTEAGKNRVIPIRPEGRKYFEYFAALSSGKYLLLDGYDGNHDVANFRKREYYPLLQYLGIKRKTPHATRHTYASRAVREGMSREVLQKILGHASYTTTADVYVHADISTLISAVEQGHITNGLLTNSLDAEIEKPP